MLVYEKIRQVDLLEYCEPQQYFSENPSEWISNSTKNKNEARANSLLQFKGIKFILSVADSCITGSPRTDLEKYL